MWWVPLMATRCGALWLKASGRGDAFLNAGQQQPNRCLAGRPTDGELVVPGAGAGRVQRGDGGPEEA
jgi:hypothetical protein